MLHPVLRSVKLCFWGNTPGCGMLAPVTGAACSEFCHLRGVRASLRCSPERASGSAASRARVPSQPSWGTSKGDFRPRNLEADGGALSAHPAWTATASAAPHWGSLLFDLWLWASLCLLHMLHRTERDCTRRLPLHSAVSPLVASSREQRPSFNVVHLIRHFLSGQCCLCQLRKL